MLYFENCDKVITPCSVAEVDGNWGMVREQAKEPCLSFPLHKSQFLTGTVEQKNKLALQHYLSVPVAVFYFLILFVVAYEYHTCTWYCTWSKNLMIDTYFLSHV